MWVKYFGIKVHLEGLIVKKKFVLGLDVWNMGHDEGLGESQNKYKRKNKVGVKATVFTEDVLTVTLKYGKWESLQQFLVQSSLLLNQL